MSTNETPISSLKEEFEKDLNYVVPKENVAPSNNSFKPKGLDSKKTKIFLIISILVLLVGIGWFAYATFLTPKTFVKEPIVDETSNNKPKPVLPEDVDTTDFPNPINGVYLTKERYDSTTNRKPVAIMINNHVDARPQAGLSQADVIYEIVAESGISRYMAVFHSQIPERVGPIRSARIYYMQIAKEYFPIFSHWGIAHRPPYEVNLPESEFQALLASGQAETDPRADARSYIDEIVLPVANTDTTPNIFYRESIPNVAIEHTGYIKFNEVYDAFANYYPEPSWSEYEEFDIWSFKDAPLEDSGLTAVNTISYNFWDMGGFETTWKYNSEKNIYIKEQGGAVVTDRNTETEVEVKNLIIQYTTETKLNDKKAHLLYDVIGSGNATYYIDGKKIEGTWSKSSAEERTMYYDKKGNPIEFNRGLFWITVLPTYSEVTEE